MTEAGKSKPPNVLQRLIIDRKSKNVDSCHGSAVQLFENRVFVGRRVWQAHLQVGSKSDFDAVICESVSLFAVAKLK